ncbi:DUF1990 family protein [Cryptosporangium arvum]|uniref:DUF1990 family protein n=1 Tax=Cryptosporangium arvum TaxID=80871 RepID=UPI0004B588FD|nr:DUF1990 domain-containing protein [Cryptosporangium arvum]
MDEWNYPEIGAVGRGERPPGYGHFTHRVRLGGPDHFPTAVDALFTGRMHARAGIRLRASAPAVAPGVVLVQRLRVGPIVVVAPVRLLEVVREDDRAWMTYGTLRGHPEQGEERFLIERGEAVTFTITGFVRPAAWYARLGAPVSHFYQRLITRRYLRALREEPA